mmetsp:Transcript_17742/g.23671  ORF Transcript_17742/g.23671 Transcript_17742/m.23671 type:complete len:102 (-) Transcript_17742:891-1196(-)
MAYTTLCFAECVCNKGRNILSAVQGNKYTHKLKQEIFCFLYLKKREEILSSLVIKQWKERKKVISWFTFSLSLFISKYFPPKPAKNLCMPLLKREPMFQEI